VFSDSEQEAFLNNEALLTTVVKALADRGITAALEPASGGAMAYDAVVRLQARGVECRYAAILKSTLTTSSIAAVSPDLGLRPLLITSYITPGMAQACRALGIQYVDSVGNMYVDFGSVLIEVDGRKPRAGVASARPRRPRLFQASGLKILFALLCCPRLVDRPYREISKASNAALGSVQLVITELINSNYVEVQGSSRRLHRSRELFERWVEAYGMTLYPQLRLGQYEADELAPWLEGRLPIRDFDAQWGGEVAAKQIVGYIRPSTVTVYAPGTPARLLAKMRARRSDEGAIQIRRRFWGDLEDSDSATVPAPLVYADLVASGDPRQIETAKRMRGGDGPLGLIDTDGPAGSR